MRGDGLYKIPNSPFCYFKVKRSGRWIGVSTKTRNYVEAKRKRGKVLQDQEVGLWPTGDIARWPFERAASQYILSADMRLRPRSLKKELSFLVRPKKSFGNLACELITAAHIHQLRAEMKKDGCKNTYNNLVVGATVRVLRYAKVWRRIRDDVTRLSERDIKPVARVLELEEKTRLFQVASSNLNWTVAYAAGLIAANTTARGADLKGVRWSDVDLFEGVIAIPDNSR